LDGERRNEVVRGVVVVAIHHIDEFSAAIDGEGDGIIASGEGRATNTGERARS